jgi:hypothetical protein
VFLSDTIRHVKIESQHTTNRYFLSENLTPKSGRHKISVEKNNIWNQNKWEKYVICPTLNERRN